MHNDDMNEMAKRHTAGAIINHISPFDHLVTHKNDFELTDDFIKKWCIPYYMEIGNPYNTTWQEQVKLIKGDISKEICLALLGDFNWRTRLAGAYFAAVKRYDDMVDVIGTHLVKSELCCVGFTYAMVLAFFNNEKAIHYLRTYLDYYLTTTFAFDQRHVLEALIFLDKENHTNLFDAYWHKWNTFIEKKKAHEIVQAKAMTQALKEQSGFDNTQIIEKLIQRVEEELSTEHITKQVGILKRLHAF